MTQMTQMNANLSNYKLLRYPVLFGGDNNKAMFAKTDKRIAVYQDFLQFFFKSPVKNYV